MFLPPENGVMCMNFRPRFLALAAIFLGIGILITCFLPAQLVVVIVAVAIIAVGVICLRR